CLIFYPHPTPHSFPSSLHDALPIPRVSPRPLVELQQRKGADSLPILAVACGGGDVARRLWAWAAKRGLDWRIAGCDKSPVAIDRSEEHTSELQSLRHLVCRLLLEKK